MPSRYIIITLLSIFTSHIFNAYAMPGVEATEYTQILNHEALLREIEKISSLVIEQQKMKKVAINQYLLAQAQASTIDPNQIKNLVNKSLLIDKFLIEISNFGTYFKRYEDMIARRSREISALKIDEKKYIEEEINLSNELGGIYKRTIDDDIAIIKLLDKKSSSLADSISAIERINGPTQGLQILSTQLENLNHHIRNLEKILLYQDINKSTISHTKNQQKAYIQTILKNSLDIQKKRDQRDRDLKKQNLTSSWNYLSRNNSLSERDTT